MYTDWTAHSKAHGLLEIERGTIVGIRLAEDSIPETVIKIGIPQFMVLRMYQEYLMEDISVHRGQRNDRLRILNDRDQTRLARIVCGDIKIKSF